MALASIETEKLLAAKNHAQSYMQQIKVPPGPKAISVIAHGYASDFIGPLTATNDIGNATLTLEKGHRADKHLRYQPEHSAIL